MKYVDTFYCVIVIFLINFLSSDLAFTQNANKKTNPISEYEDCSDPSIIIDQTKGPLTKEERIALMEKAFFSSLNKFDRCQTSTTSAGGSASNSSTSGSRDQGGANGLTGEANNNNNIVNNSVASNEISGSEGQPPSKETKDSGINVQGKGGTFKKNDTTLTNGKIPEDIPPAQNDSILEAQIRLAAETETDPVKKAKLWNQYRRYKGLKIIQGADDN